MYCKKKNCENRKPCNLEYHLVNSSRTMFTCSRAILGFPPRNSDHRPFCLSRSASPRPRMLRGRSLLSFSVSSTVTIEILWSGLFDIPSSAVDSKFVVSIMCSLSRFSGPAPNVPGAFWAGGAEGGTARHLPSHTPHVLARN